MSINKEWTRDFKAAALILEMLARTVTVHAHLLSLQFSMAISIKLPLISSVRGRGTIFDYYICR